MLIGYIYVITNDINGKQYVGKTTDTIENRFKDHCKDYMLTHCSHRPLYYAMNKYGREHFSIAQLEECPLEILGEREQYWIEKLDTYKNGYNGTHGGDGSQLYDYNLFIADYNQGMNIGEIAEKYDCAPDTVSKALKKANLDTSRGTRNAKRKNSQIVYQYDMQENFIQEFHSYWAAARWIIENNYTKSTNVGQIHNNISGAARKIGYRKSAYGFKWELTKL